MTSKEPKLWWAAILALIIVIGLPFLLERIGVVGGIKGTAWAAIWVMLALIWLKVVSAPAVSGRFTYARQGNDLCMLGLSGGVAIVALQLGAATDLLPGLRRIVQDETFLPAQSVPLKNVTIASAIWLASLGFYILTSVQVAAIRKSEEENKTAGYGKAHRFMALRAILCYALGVISVITYIVLLVMK